MTVPTPRQVARNPQLWWPPDQADKHITPAQAFWLRRGMHHKMPGLIARGLARRGLLAGRYIGQPATGLTSEGERIQRLLGRVPDGYLHGVRWAAHTSSLVVQQAPAITPVPCDQCERHQPAELIAWGWYDERPNETPLLCVECARRLTTKGATATGRPARVAEERTTP